MCGEKWAAISAASQHRGSPPRVRGKVKLNAIDHGFSRITPACAGKSPLYLVFRLGVQDHPRVCGEKSISDRAASYSAGSPPRVRGKVPGGAGHRKQPGITPACAGKRLPARPPRGEQQDHPRVCGEKLGHTYRVEQAQGSPPRVRGKAARREQSTAMHGITPACAGKSHCNAYHR